MANSEKDFESILGEVRGLLGQYDSWTDAFRLLYKLTEEILVAGGIPSPRISIPEPVIPEDMAVFCAIFMGDKEQDRENIRFWKGYKISLTRIDNVNPATIFADEGPSGLKETADE